MTLKNCIAQGNKKVKGKKIISDAKAKELSDQYDIFYEQYIKEGLDSSEAARKAGIETLNQKKIEAAAKIKETKNAKEIKESFIFGLERFTKMNKNIPDPKTVLESVILDTTLKQGFKRMMSLEESIKLYENIFDKKMAEVLQTFRYNALGVNRNKATLEAVGQEIFELGSSGNKTAQQLATAWLETAEYARKLFNRLGGKIPKGDFGYLPQIHDEYLVGSVEYADWKNFLIDEDILDVDKMINYKTGAKFTDAELELALTDVYNNIKNFGVDKKGKAAHARKISNRRLDHRFLRFKDFNAWQKYMNKFGKNTNVFDTMIAHLKGMARDIATMKTLSANPERMVDWMIDTADEYLIKNRKLFKGDDRAFRKTRESINKAKKNMNIGLHLINGGHNIEGNILTSKIFSGLRDLTTAAYLGSATFLAFGDFNLTRMASQYIGLQPTKAMASNLKTFVSGLKEDSSLIKTASTSGLAAEFWSTLASAAARSNVGETASPQWTKRVADFTLRASGLSWLTQAGRWGAGTEMMGYLARISDNSWDELGKINPKFKSFLETFNITKENWDAFRSIKKYNPDDVEFPDAEYLRPGDLLDSDLDEDLAIELYSKFQGAVNNFVDFAVPVAKLRGQLFLGYTQPGTVSGEILRSVLQFKQFPLTFHFTHIMRVIGMSSKKDAMLMGADLLLSTTLMGALAYELKQITKGKETTNFDKMDKEELGMYAFDKMFHGGGLGFIGDLINNFRFGREIDVGASLGVVLGATDLTLGNALQELSGKDSNFQSELFNFIKKNTPGSSLWYGRLASERLFFDWLQEQIDPKYPQKRRRLIKKTNEENTKYWWRPGDKVPNQSPF